MANIEQRVCEHLEQRSASSSGEIAKALRLDPESSRHALERLRRKGVVDVARTRSRLTLYFLVRGAQRPQEKRGGHRRRTHV